MRPEETQVPSFSSGQLRALTAIAAGLLGPCYEDAAPPRASTLALSAAACVEA
jgi:hypothetical protein